MSKGGTTEPFELQVAKGDIPGHSSYFKTGTIASQGTTEAIINSAGFVPAYQTAAGVAKISSASTDDAAAGTGCRTVLITGLSAAYVVISETVTLNGQTAVNTTLSYLRITNIQPATFGAGGVSAGIIYAGTGVVTTGVPATLYLQCAAGASDVADLGAYAAMSDGYELYITAINLVAGVSSNTATIAVKVRTLESATWTTYYTFVTTVNGSDYIQFPMPIRVPAGSEFAITSDASATTISASAVVEGILIAG